jgi:deoxyribose-phosphate aldolase
MNQKQTINEISLYFDIYNKIDLTFLDTDINKIHYYLYKFKDHEYNSFCTLQNHVSTVYENGIKNITMIVGYPFSHKVSIDQDLLLKSDTVEFWIESSRVYRDPKKIFKTLRRSVIKSHAAGVKIRAVTEFKSLTMDNIKEFLLICKDANVDSIQTGYGLTNLNDSWIPELKSKIGNDFEIKAVGGINSIEHAEKLIKAGADLIGSSTI